MLFCRTCSFKCISFVSDEDGHQHNEPKAESEPPKKKKKDKQKVTEEPKEWVNVKQCQIEYNWNVELLFVS